MPVEPAWISTPCQVCGRPLRVSPAWCALHLNAELEAARQQAADAHAAVLDIDAHATPLGSDDDGFVSTGYLVSVGSLHRALGVVGHGAAKCRDVPCERANAAEAEAAALRTALEELVEATAAVSAGRIERACAAARAALAGTQPEGEKP